MILIELPGLPRGKGRPRFSARGGFARAYTDAKTQSYEGALRMAGAVAMAGREPVAEALTLEMVAVFPVPASWSKKKKAEAQAGAVHPTGKPDCDNLLKCIDALNGIVWRDDAQVIQASVTKRYGDVPGLAITVLPATRNGRAEIVCDPTSEDKRELERPWVKRAHVAGILI